MSYTAVYKNGLSLYNNGKIAITKDRIFGLSVWSECDGVEGWLPLLQLTKEELYKLDRLIDFDPLFMWGEQFHHYILAAEAA